MKSDFDYGKSIGRRNVLLGGAGLMILSAGCLGDNPDHDPIDLTGGMTCDICGMVIEEHFGPAAQAFYDGLPHDRDGPMRFDSVREMAQHDAGVDRRLEAGFATDYSRVSGDITAADETPYISTIATANAFSPVDELSFVVESEIRGAMGPDAIPYSDPADADLLVEEYGGDVVAWEELPWRDP